MTGASLSAPKAKRNSSRLWRRFMVISRRANFFLLLEISAVIAVLAMMSATYLAFTRAPPDGELLPSAQVALLLIGTLIPAMGILVLFGRRMAIRRAAGSTARLHVRLVFFFSLVAAIPTLLVAAFAAVLFQSGVDFWFSDNSRGLMRNANELAEGYYEQNQLQVSDETITMAADMRDFLERVPISDPAFADFYQFQVQARDLSESAVLQRLPDATLRTAAAVNLGSELVPTEELPQDGFERLAAGEAVVVKGDEGRIKGLAAIDRESGIFLYTARNSEALPFKSWESATAISAAYEVLTTRARALQLRFNLALFVVALGLVGMAVWFALRFADRQVEPLTDLVLAARKVGAGNFAMRVEGRTGADEIGLLNRAFNRMTAQIEKQTTDLVGANAQLDQRRAFVEALLESTSAGIISIGPDDQILLMNSTAQNVLGQEGAIKADDDLSSIAPQISALVEAGVSDGVVTYSRGSDILTLAVKIATAPDGKVITFEDITRQLLYQRQAAWSDVARRIAHEIKNPLTPIQLATERLKRRYRKQIEIDGELFDDLTNTIVRQVGDLRKMVDEFSSFARLPKPVFRSEDALDLVRQALFLQEVGNADIQFSFDTNAEPPVAMACDRHQVGQALTNVLKNAVEAVEARSQAADIDYRGRIAVSLHASDAYVVATVQDNGIGLPEQGERIVEPYVTTRAKGTGLGLAIVNKIVEEHGGEMTFSAVADGGTMVALKFARDPVPALQSHSDQEGMV